MDYKKEIIKLLFTVTNERTLMFIYKLLVAYLTDNTKPDDANEAKKAA